MKKIFNNRFALLLPTLALLLAGTTLVGCSDSSDADGANVDATQASETAPTNTVRRVRVETQILSPTSFEDVIEITGSVEAYNDATVSAQTAGTLVYKVPRGTYVRKNGRIAQIDSTLMHAAYLQTRAQYDAAKAQFDLAEDTFNRQQPLYQDSIISALEFQSVRTQKNQAEAQLNQAKAMLTQTREQLDFTRLSASFGGTVETYFAEIGEQITPGMPVVRVVNTNQVKVAAGVPERYANDIKPGASVNVMLDTYGDKARAGKVSFVGKAININNRTFPVEIQLDNSDQLLKPEMVARLQLTRETLTDVIVIPQDAVPLDETGHSVYVVVDEGGTLVAERRNVTLGAAHDGMVVVEQGLYAGDEVVVTGQHNLTQGDAVEVVEATSALSEATNN